MAATTIYKPESNQGPAFLTPTSGSAPTITLANGQVVTAVPGNKVGGSFYNEGRYKWIFPRSVLGQSGTISYNGESTALESTNQSYEGSSMQNWKARAKGSVGSGGGGGAAGGAGGGGYVPGSTFGGGFAGGQAAPTFADASSLFFKPVSVPAIPIPGYTPIDPQVYAQQVAGQNRGEYLTNLGLSQAAALGFTNTEVQGLGKFSPQASALQQSLVSSENAFNQGQVANANLFNPTQIVASNQFNKSQLDASIMASGLPIRETITEGLDRARQLSKGFLPTTLEDRAFEMAARSKAGDALVAKGLGTSSFTQNAIDKYTIGERLNLAAIGTSQAASYLEQGVKLLVDSPIKYNPLLSSPLSAKASQDVRGTPSFSVGATQQAEQGNIGQATMMTPSASLSLYDQQRQYRAQLENNVNQFNANLDFNSQTFNSTGNFNQQLTQLSSDQTNASQAYNFAQTNANYVNGIYQQQLASYAQSQGFAYGGGTAIPAASYGSGISPTAPLSSGPGLSPAYRQ